MNARKEQKLEELKTMLDNGEITQKIYDKAVELEKSYSPYIFKKSKTGKIKGVTDIFAEMKAEREAKDKKKAKTAARKKAAAERKAKKNKK